MIETARHAEPPRQEYRQGNLIELGRGPVGRAVHEPVLKPRAVGALARLQMAECAQRRRRIAGVEKRCRDATQVSRPHEVIDLVAVVIRLAPWRGRRCDESARVRFVLEAAKNGQRRVREHPLVAADLAQRRRQIGQ